MRYLLKKTRTVLLFIVITAVLAACDTDAEASDDPIIITFDHEGIDAIEVDSLDDLLPPDDPQMEHHTFEGWYLDGDLTEPFAFDTLPDGDITLYPHFEPASFTIDFANTEFDSLVIAYGESIPEIDDPDSGEHQTFEGWYLDEDFQDPFDADTMPPEDLTLYARFEDITYTVSFEHVNLDDVDVVSGEIYELPTPDTADNETFEGWYFDADFTDAAGDVITVEDDMTLYARIETTGPYTISFENTGDYDIPDQEYEEGETLVLELDMFKTGHVFDGWYVDPDFETPFTDTTMPAENMTLYANWTPIEYTILFDTDDGEALDPLRLEYGDSLDLPEPQAPEGMTFVGWFWDPDFENPLDIDTMPAYAIFLYAKFAPETFAVHFETFDGEALEPLVGVTGDTIELPTDVDHDTMVFFGWYFDADFEEKAGDTVVIGDEDITLYAYLVEEETLTVSFETFGGTELESIELSTGDTLPGDLVPERDEYIFSAWYLDEERTEHFDMNTPIVEDMTLYAAYGSEGLEFTLNDDEASYAVEMGTAMQESIVIPARHEGLPVTVIAQEGFSEQDVIKAITLPKTLEVIELWAFFEAEALESIHIPERVVEIGLEAFMNAYSLETVTFDENIELEAFYWHLFFNAHSLKNIEIPRSVTKIYPSVFYENHSLESIVIPNTVEIIREYAFYHNTSLETVIFEENSNLETIGWMAFAYNDNITDIVIPKSVVTIEGHAFRNMGGVETITFEEGSQLKHIGASAFREIPNVTKITLPDTVETLGNGAFQDMMGLTSIDLGSSLVTMQSSVFRYNENLESITLPDTLETIGTAVFLGTGIESVHIPASVTMIGISAFSSNENLTNVTFEEGIDLEIISASAFAHTSLVTITIPASVSEFNLSALSGIETLQEINVEDANEHYTSQNGVLFNSDMTELITYPANRQPYTHYDVPDTVTAIVGTGFSNNQHLETIALPPALETIGAGSFLNAQSLKSIHIPSSVTSIGPHAFQDAVNLETVTFGSGIDLDEIDNKTFKNTAIESIEIPESVRWIRFRAFYNTYDLNTIYVNRSHDDGITHIHWDTFNTINANPVTIFVPAGSLEAYQEGLEWDAYSNRIFESD